MKLNLHLFVVALLCPGVESISYEQRVLAPCPHLPPGDERCSGQQTSMPESHAHRRFQSANLSTVQAYAQIHYEAHRKSAQIHVKTFLHHETRDRLRLRFQFGPDTRPWQLESRLTVRQGDHAPGEGLRVRIGIQHDLTHVEPLLTLDPLYFVWDNIVPSRPETRSGQKGAIVELFGWPYEDVAAECSFLAKAGYMGVKIFPAQEHVFSDYYLERGELNPWYFVYQPVSYRLHSRLGSREQLRSMIVTCRKAGVRVYADAVINHMTGSGNDVLYHTNPQAGCARWGPKNSTAGSPYYTHGWPIEVNARTHLRPAMEYPAVPYGPEDFHCERSLGDWSSGFSLNYGWLVGLSDLNTERQYVRERIADYFVDLLSIGFSGFRIDAAKHIQPKDLAAIFGIFRKRMGNTDLPEDFLSWLEVIIGGERMLLACQDNWYNYYGNLDREMEKAGLSTTDIAKVKIWSSDYPKEHPICGHWVLPAKRFVVQNDDHDQQNPGSSSRDMADKGSVLIKERNVERHRNFEVQLFTRTDADWDIRVVLSGYTFMENGAQGYPDGFSDCKRYKGNPFTGPHEKCKSVPYSKAHQPDSCGYSMIENGKWQEGAYTRVHRDVAIIKAMRQWMGLQTSADLGLPAKCTA